MATVKTYLVRFDEPGNIVATKELDQETAVTQAGLRFVVVRAKNPTNANKAALALRGE